MMLSDTFAQWEVLLIPLVVLIISQVTKVVLESSKSGFQWAHLNSYGGMPSSHTALFVSVTLMIGFTEGFSSALFALAGLTAAVFIRDAFGIRWSLGFHGKVLNHLIQTLPAEERKRFPKHLEERWGHTHGEVLAGAVLGILLTILLYVLMHGTLVTQ